MPGMFDKFLSELQKTLGGGPGKEGRGDVGAFEQDAIDGGKRVLAPIADVAKSALTPYSQSLASPYTEEDFQRMQASEAAPSLPTPIPMKDVPLAASEIPKIVDTTQPPATEAEPQILSSTPTSIAEPGLPTPVVKASSRAKHKPDVAKVASVSSSSSPPTTTASETQPTDAIAALLKENADKYGSERDAAIAAARDAEKLTDEEKIATALLAALPGLAGLIGGAAIGGGQGAVAGLAGGLTGGAQGIGSINDAKQAKRKEALTKAEKAGDRLARVDDQKLSHAESLQGQQFTAQRDDKQMAAHEKLTDKQIAASAANTNKQIAANRLLKEMDVIGDLKKAELTAKNNQPKATEADAAFYKNTGQAMRSIDNINALYKAGGGAQAWLTNPDSRAELLQAVNMLSHSVTKINDPTSAVLLAELENTMKTMLDNPDTTRAQVFLKKVNKLKEYIAPQAEDYSRVRPQVPVHETVNQFRQQEQHSQTPDRGGAPTSIWSQGKPIQR